jgi:hypothetical protein
MLIPLYGALTFDGLAVDLEEAFTGERFTSPTITRS